MPRTGKIFVNALLAGISIGIAGTVYLATSNPLLGAFLFALGLLTIVCYQFKLFTGAVGYWANQRGNAFFSYFLELVIIWCGNLAGCLAVGMLVRRSRILPNFEERVLAMCNAKLADTPSSLVILAFFCGILMYVAVESFRKEKLPGMTRTLMVILCVAVFILSGFEHSIAGMYYFSVAGMWSRAAMQCVLLMTLGNTLGGILIPIADKLRKLQ